MIPPGSRMAKTNYLNGIAPKYIYDSLYELMQVTRGTSYHGGATATIQWAIDCQPSGVPNYSYNASNVLTSDSSGSYSYDANGDTLSDAQGRSFTWDFENRLTQAVVPGTNGGTTTFKYDPFGRRIQKSGPLGTTNYLYDGFNAVEDVDNSGNVLARYAQDHAVDQPLSELRSGTTSDYELDGIGSVTSLSNSTGALANTYTYDSFGKLSSPTGTLTNPFQYTGRDFDTETGLFYYRARYYDPVAGRFISEDPIGSGGGINAYAYVGNDPTILVDPFGLDKGPWHPPKGVHTKCLPTDLCPIIEQKMWLLARMFDSHDGWDSHLPAPRGGDRHSRPLPGNPMGDIGQIYKQWEECHDLYEEKCKGGKPCDKTPEPDPAPKGVPVLPILPMLEEIIGILAFL